MKQAFNKYLKGAKKATLAPPPPRDMGEISKEYSDICAKVGHTQYRIKVLEQDLKALFDRIVALDQEGFARKTLDEAAAKEMKAAALTPNAQVPNEQAGQ